MAGDELTAALRELAQEVRALRYALEQSSVPREPIASGGVMQSTPIGEVRDTAQPQQEASETSVVLTEVKALISSMFEAALADDEELAFEQFVGCMHSDRVDAPRSIPSLREFNWKSIRKNAKRYLDDALTPSSFVVERVQPDAPAPDIKSVKVFLRCGGRSPVPITFKRDLGQDDALRVTDSSL